MKDSFKFPQTNIYQAINFTEIQTSGHSISLENYVILCYY